MIKLRLVVVRGRLVVVRRRLVVIRRRLLLIVAKLWLLWRVLVVVLMVGWRIGMIMLYLHRLVVWPWCRSRQYTVHFRVVFIKLVVFY